MPYSSSRPDTLRYDDLSYNSTDEDEHQQSSHANHRAPSSQKRVTISDRYMHAPRDSLRPLENHNTHLSRENLLLKEQLRLKEEALRLHGLQIMSDVIHLLDQHHIKCDQHRAPELSPPPYRDRRDPESTVRREFDKTSERISSSPYERELHGEHELLADLARGDNHTQASRQSNPSREEPRNRSASIESTELEDILENSYSASNLVGKPKHTSTPYRRRTRYKTGSRKPGGNCNVNARHMSPEIHHRPREAGSESDLESLNLNRVDDLNSSYFPRGRETAPPWQFLRGKEMIAHSGHEQVKEIKKQDMLAHWKVCEHRDLHVAPTKPPVVQVKAKKCNAKETDKKGQFRKIDLNRTFTINKEGSCFLHTNVKAAKSTPGVICAGVSKAKKAKPKAPSRPPSAPPPLTCDTVNDRETAIRQPPLARADNSIPPGVQKKAGKDVVNKMCLLESNHNRVLGEIAFQLDKRILSFVLNGKFNRECKYKSFYGYNVVNLQQMIIEREQGEVKEVMLDRYKFLMRTLHSLGYVFPHHANFAVMLVNKYGVMKQSKEDVRQIALSVHQEPLLRDLVQRNGTAAEIKDTLVLLQCLAVMCADDGLPMFIW